MAQVHFIVIVGMRIELRFDLRSIDLRAFARTRLHGLGQDRIGRLTYARGHDRVVLQMLTPSLLHQQQAIGEFAHKFRVGCTGGIEILWQASQCKHAVLLGIERLLADLQHRCLVTAYIGCGSAGLRRCHAEDRAHR